MIAKRAFQSNLHHDKKGLILSLELWGKKREKMGLTKMNGKLGKDQTTPSILLRPQMTHKEDHLSEESDKLSSMMTGIACIMELFGQINAVMWQSKTPIQFNLVIVEEGCTFFLSI